jgi:hypothetical protein
MKTRRTSNSVLPRREAVLWIDHDQALIVGQTADGWQSAELLDRAPAESAASFGARMVHEVVDEDRLIVSGPTNARTDFERAYVAMTHRPDRLVDVEPTRWIPREARPA